MLAGQSKLRRCPAVEVQPTRNKMLGGLAQQQPYFKLDGIDVDCLQVLAKKGWDEEMRPLGSLHALS